ADGINITDPNVGDGSLNLPYNFVREVQVTTGGYEAEYGRTQGGLVNVVTNSGGNEFHGQVLGFFTGDGLRAAPRWGVGQSQVAKFSQYDVGFSLGGPIRRDRLWFYAAYNPSFEASDANLPGIPTQRDTRTTHLFAGKLTARLGAATDVTLTLLGDPSVRDLVGGVALATVADAGAVLGRLREGGTAVALQLRHQIGARLLLGASLARLDREEDETPRAGPSSDPATLTQIEDDINNVTSGGFGYSQTAHTSRTSGQVSLTVLAGSHALKLGAEYEDNAIRLDGYGSQVTIDTGTVAGHLDTTYSLLQLGNHADAHNYIPAVYLQDSWAVSGRLRLNVGLRWEGQFMDGDTGVARWIAPELAPRLALVFQPGEPGTDKVSVSYGRYFEAIPATPLIFWTGTFFQTNGVYPHNPLADTTGGVVQGGSQVGEAPDRNIKGQQYDEWSAGYERRLGRSYRIALRGTYRTLLWAVEDGAPDPNSPFTTGNPGRGALAYLPRAKRDYRALELTFERAAGRLSFRASYVLSRSWGNYTGLYATDVLDPLDNAGPQFDFPEQAVNAAGPLPNDRRHVVKFVGSYQLPMGLTVGTSALAASGEPLSEYGTGPYPPYWTFVVPRGTAGRTPSTWNVDLRFAYDAPVSRDSRLRPRILLDVFNVGNQRKALTYDQRHYTAPGLSGVNPNYLAVTQYQAPLHARMGVVFDF
ncbi:MAG TPA: TonB-dependent receptor, partial [Gemmatimonadales bacterium]|nr:TonB-dependent receptor [Gemmatimonadales bacterium]